jgi:hypothetical protein
MHPFQIYQNNIKQQFKNSECGVRRIHINYIRNWYFDGNNIIYSIEEDLKR